MECIPTWWWVRTAWRVYNPHAEWVQINVRCNRYGYDYWYWIAPNSSFGGHWGCEGRPLYITNHAPQNSILFVQATTW